RRTPPRSDLRPRLGTVHGTDPGGALRHAVQPRAGLRPGDAGGRRILSRPGPALRPHRCHVRTLRAVVGVAAPPAAGDPDPRRVLPPRRRGPARDRCLGEHQPLDTSELARWIRGLVLMATTSEHNDLAAPGADDGPTPSGGTPVQP